MGHFPSNARVATMILTCPQCETRYRVEAAQFLTAGRKVRCAKCGNIWHQAPPEPESTQQQEFAVPPGVTIDERTGAADVVSSPADRVLARKAAPRERPWAERLGLIAGWAALAAMIFLIGWMGLRFRQEIAVLWPPSSSLYGTFGVAVNVHGIAINNWTYRWETENGQSVVVVTGNLVNLSSRELTVPPVRVALTDDDQRELYHWTFKPPQPTLKPGHNLSFLTRLSSPPPGARHLQLRFASQD